LAGTHKTIAVDAASIKYIAYCRQENIEQESKFRLSEKET